MIFWAVPNSVSYSKSCELFLLMRAVSNIVNLVETKKHNHANSVHTWKRRESNPQPKRCEANIRTSMHKISKNKYPMGAKLNCSWTVMGLVCFALKSLVFLKNSTRSQESGTLAATLTWKSELFIFWANLTVWNRRTFQDKNLCSLSHFNLRIVVE